MATAADRQPLQDAMTMHVTPGVPWDNTNPVKRALDDAGIQGFEHHLIPCKEAVLQHLEDPSTPSHHRRDSTIAAVTTHHAANPADDRILPPRVAHHEDIHGHLHLPR